MIAEVPVQMALRSKLLTLAVATTGTTNLAATAIGYTRTTGSFIADGIGPGMEAVASGFANNGPVLITYVSALTLAAQRIVTTVVNGKKTYSLAPLTTEAAADGRALTVGLPTQQAWENKEYQATAGIPWVREEFLPGPSSQVTTGPQGELEAEPQYVVYVNVASDTGLTAKRYVDALRVLFAHRTKIPVPNVGTLQVRADTGPYAGQLQNSTAGFATQPFSVPLRLRSQNSI